MIRFILVYVLLMKPLYENVYLKETFANFLKFRKIETQRIELILDWFDWRIQIK